MSDALCFRCEEPILPGEEAAQDVHFFNADGSVTEGGYPWAPGAKTHYVRLLPALLTGRRIAVPDGAPSNWFG